MQKGRQTFDPHEDVRTFEPVLDLLVVILSTKNPCCLPNAQTTKGLL